MKDILRKRYYRIEFTTSSAMCVGGSSGIETDKDIAYDSRGIPYIAASSLTGIYRTFFSEKTRDKYFGKIDMTGDNEESKIIVYDANVKDDNWFVSKRDCVALDSLKTSIKGAKFDFQILEPGVRFVTYIEQDICTNDENTADIIADAWKEEKIKIGGKTSRGLGCVKDVDIKVLDFSFKDPKSIDDWIEFNIYDKNDSQWKNANSWETITKKYKEDTPQDRIHIKLDMVQRSPISIRIYTTDVKPDNIGENIVRSQEDFSHIAYINSDNTLTYIIPGTSWAGAFKHHIERLGFKNTQNYFGRKGNKDDDPGKRSDIIFSESVIENGKSKIISRNAIDRFTGGTVENALFTENVCYGGKTSLEISLKKDSDLKFLSAVAAATADLHGGFLAVGGETSVGHGLFKLTGIKCADKEILPTGCKEVYEGLLDAMLVERER